MIQGVFMVKQQNWQNHRLLSRSHLWGDRLIKLIHNTIEFSLFYGEYIVIPPDQRLKQLSHK
ncbi:hypothetical protein SPLC1_S100580 [Arthrospira platensis C1]|nr:hypothetical protein SPLC1_S100580 [Arthrospira platensis C1]